MNIVQDRSMAAKLVEDHHYSGKLPGTKHPFVLLTSWDESMAACVYGPSVGRWTGGAPLELVRLVVDPFYRGTFILSEFVAKTLKMLDVDLVISYADPHEGHHGGIYQALSWKYHGGQKSKDRKGKSLYAFQCRGEIIHARVVNRRFGTTSLGKLKELWKDEWVPLFRDPKHLYWKALNRRGIHEAKRRGLKEVPYPCRSS